MTKRTKRKKPIHCPVCNKGFSYNAKTAPIGRLSKHIKNAHPKYKRAKSTKSKRQREMEYTDDMIVNSLRQYGIPLQAPPQAPPQQPIQHESIVGAILTGISIGEAIHKGVKARKAKKKGK